MFAEKLSEALPKLSSVWFYDGNDFLEKVEVKETPCFDFYQSSGFQFSKVLVIQTWKIWVIRRGTPMTRYLERKETFLRIANPQSEWLVPWPGSNLPQAIWPGFFGNDYLFRIQGVAGDRAIRIRAVCKSRILAFEFYFTSDGRIKPIKKISDHMIQEIVGEFMPLEGLYAYLFKVRLLGK